MPQIKNMKVSSVPNLNKILLIRNVSAEKYGGGETYQLKLAEQLKSHGFSPIILTNSRKLLRDAKADSVKTFVPPYIHNQNWSGAKNLLLPAYFFQLKRQQKWYEQLFRRERPDVINVQSRDDWLSATRAAQKLGIKVLWTDHADFRNWVLWNIDRPFKNPIGKQITKLSKVVDKVVFISNFEHDYFTSYSQLRKQTNLLVISNGVKDELAKYCNIKPSPNSFIYLGRLTDEKGLLELLKAFAKVSKKFPSAKLNLYGDGPGRSKYQSLASDNPNIIFHGETEEPLRTLAEHEFFILPSHNEGLSLSLLEAAMMQKTIITTDVGAAEEVVGRDASGGYLIHPKSAEALASAMLDVLETKTKAKKMAQIARHTYETSFNLDHIFEEKMLPLYNTNK